MRKWHSNQISIRVWVSIFFCIFHSDFQKKMFYLVICRCGIIFTLINLIRLKLHSTLRRFHLTLFFSLIMRSFLYAMILHTLKLAKNSPSYMNFYLVLQIFKDFLFKLNSSVFCFKEIVRLGLSQLKFHVFFYFCAWWKTEFFIIFITNAWL